MNHSYLITEKTICYKELLKFMSSVRYQDDNKIYICINYYTETLFLIAEHVDHFTENEDIYYLNDNFEGFWNKLTKRQSFKIHSDLDKLYPLTFKV